MLMLLFGLFASIGGILAGRGGDTVQAQTQVRQSSSKDEAAPSKQQYKSPPLEARDENDAQSAEKPQKSAAKQEQPSQKTSPAQQEEPNSDPAQTPDQDPAAQQQSQNQPEQDPATQQKTSSQQDAPSKSLPTEAPSQDAGEQGPGADGSTGSAVSGDGLEVYAGRVTTLIPEGDDIASVRILSKPAHGNLTVNSDNTLALVLSETDHTGRLDLSYEVTFSDGRIETVSPKITAVQGPVESGWGLGDFYMLETDADGNVIVEHGDNHRDVYVSGSGDALSLSDIARMEGLKVADITGNWLSKNPHYGSSPEAALDDEAGRMLWRQLALDSQKSPASHWLHLEAGHEYDMGSLFYSGMTGESALHPLHITAYGSGEKPIITSSVNVTSAGATNVVISDIAFHGGGTLNPSSNILMENITSTGDKEFAILNVDGFTLRNSEIYDHHKEAPYDPDGWSENKDRISGLYFGKSTSGVLIENSLFDRNGWEEGYYGLDADSPQAPSIFNHNVYISNKVTDVTFRDNISMRAASFGAQFRGGAVVEDNVFLDNNGAVYVAGGVDSTGEYDGNYSLYLGNVTTSGGNREYGFAKGQLAGGMGDYAPLTALVDNIVTHLADPNDPADLASKTNTHWALKSGDTPYYNDTIVYNWVGANAEKDARDANTAGLDGNVLDKTTIQLFAADLLGDPDAEISDLALYLRDSAEGAFDGVSDAELIVEFFRAGFGLEVEDRVIAETLRFEPDDLADGMRWDNRLNWSTDDLPGTAVGDSVDLAGNTVIYGGTTRIKDLDFGDGGELRVGHGRLDVTGDVTTDGIGGTIEVDGAGQIWVSGYDGTGLLDLDVEGGRFSNTGAFTGRVDLDVTGGQALLATPGGHFDVGANSSIDISGGAAKVGFDGTTGDTAVMRFDSDGMLRFSAAEGKIGSIAEFRSGAYGDASTDVASGINFGEARLELDIAELGAGRADYTLISVDEMVGAFSEIDITGLSATRDALLIFDYEKDAVILRMFDEGKGSGVFRYQVFGDQMDAKDDDELWAALTEGQPVLGDDMVPDDVSVNSVPLHDFL